MVFRMRVISGSSSTSIFVAEEDAVVAKGSVGMPLTAADWEALESGGSLDKEGVLEG